MKIGSGKRALAKLLCHGCQNAGRLYLHVMDDNFIYALCKKCVVVQLEIEHYMRKDGSL